MAQLKRNWEELLIFFEEMGSDIDKAMGDQMNYLATKIEGLTKLEARIRMAFAKTQIYDTAFQVRIFNDFRIRSYVLFISSRTKHQILKTKYQILKYLLLFLI